MIEDFGLTLAFEVFDLTPDIDENFEEANQGFEIFEATSALDKIFDQDNP